MLMPLNTPANRCGYFFNCCLTKGYEDKPAVNNGYNCNHPECGDSDEGVGIFRPCLFILKYTHNILTSGYNVV